MWDQNAEFEDHWWCVKLTWRVLFCRRTNEGPFVGTTWQIRFQLDDVDTTETYKLRVAIASATYGELQVRIDKFRPIHLYV